MRTKQITRRFLFSASDLLSPQSNLFPLGAQVVSGQWGEHVVFHAPSYVCFTLPREGDFFIDNLLVRIHLIIEMI